MTLEERTVLLEQGMFDGPWNFLGEDLRPVTLGSLHACHCMGLPLHKGLEGFDKLPAEEHPLLLARFVWAHQADPATVEMNVLDGKYPVAKCDAVPTIVQLFRIWLERWHQLVEAASVEAVPRASWESVDNERPPRGQIDPSYLADFVWILTQGKPTAKKRRWVLWELPFTQALQYYHCRLRENRWWTVPKGAPTGTQSSALAATTAELDKSAPAEDSLAL